MVAALSRTSHDRCSESENRHFAGMTEAFVPGARGASPGLSRARGCQVVEALNRIIHLPLDVWAPALALDSGARAPPARTASDPSIIDPGLCHAPAPGGAPPSPGLLPAVAEEAAAPAPAARTPSSGSRGRRHSEGGASDVLRRLSLGIDAEFPHRRAAAQPRRATSRPAPPRRLTRGGRACRRLVSVSVKHAGGGRHRRFSYLRPLPEASGGCGDGVPGGGAVRMALPEAALEELCECCMQGLVSLVAKESTEVVLLRAVLASMQSVCRLVRDGRFVGRICAKIMARLRSNGKLTPVEPEEVRGPPRSPDALSSQRFGTLRNASVFPGHASVFPANGEKPTSAPPARACANRCGTFKSFPTTSRRISPGSSRGFRSQARSQSRRAPRARPVSRPRRSRRSETPCSRGRFRTAPRCRPNNPPPS